MHGPESASSFWARRFRIDDQVHARRIAANTLLLYLQTVVYYFAELISTRLVLAALGVNGFALFTAVILVATTLTFLNAVLSSAAQRFLSFAQGRADPGAAAESFAAALGIAVLVRLSIVALGETVGLWISFADDRGRKRIFNRRMQHVMMSLDTQM